MGMSKMGKKLVVALTLLLVACTTPLHRTEEPDVKFGPFLMLPAVICNTPNHRCIGVGVVGGAISPVPDQAFISPNHVVFFELLTAGYTFPDQAITATTTGSVAAPAILASPNEFTCKTGPMGKVVACVKRNTTAGSGSSKIYKYSIKVKEITTP